MTAGLLFSPRPRSHAGMDKSVERIIRRKLCGGSDLRPRHLPHRQRPSEALRQGRRPNASTERTSRPSTVSTSRATMRISDLHFRLVRTKRRLPLWVMNGPSAAPPKRSVPGGKADEIRAKADFGARMSEAEGRPDVARRWLESPSLARSRSQIVSMDDHEFILY